MDTRPIPENYAISKLPLNVLKFGHEYPGGSINVRVPSEADAERMAASIAREGLLQPLLVVPYPNTADGAYNVQAAGDVGPYYAVIGGRRLAGLRRLRDIAALSPSAPIAVMVAPDLGTADLLAKSLAAEDAHVPPHPVDRYESFAALQRLGMTVDEIAARHIIDKRIVRQAMALGELHADIRAAYRAGEISDEVARLFTLADDQKHQVKTLDKLRKKFSNGLADIGAETVRKFFTASEAEAKKLLAFVGREAYLAAGGRLTEDLFAGTEAEPSLIVHDVAKLKKLAEQKLEIEARRLKEGEGWSWADTKSENIGYGRILTVKPRYSDEQKAALKAIDKRVKEIAKIDDTAVDDDTNIALQAEEERLSDERQRIEDDAALAGYDTADKKKAGCVVEIDSHGGLRIRHGLIKPKETKADAEDDTPAKGRAPTAQQQPKLSWDAQHHLAEVKSQAVTAALLKAPQVALAAMLASLGTWSAPINFQGLQRSQRGWHLAFADFLALKQDELVGAIAMRAAEAADLSQVDGKTAAALLDALDLAIYDKHVSDEFSAKVYFKGASPKYMLELIEEDLGADEKRRQAEKSQKQLAAFCLDSVAVKGWLPPELRGPGYRPTAAAPKPRSGEGGKPAKAKVTVSAKPVKAGKKGKRK